MKIWEPIAKYIKLHTDRFGIIYEADNGQDAFKKDGKIVIVLFNQTDNDIPVYLRMNNECVKVDLKPWSISTGIVNYPPPKGSGLLLNGSPD